MKLRNREWLEHPPQPNILLVGGSKTGKSTGAASAPPGVLYLNTDLPNATRHVHLVHPDGEIIEPEMPPEGQPGMATKRLMDEIELGLAQNEAKAPSERVVNSVVVDPIGELYRRLLEDASLGALSPSLPQYQAAGAYLQRFCRSLCKLPITTVLVAHEWAYEVEGEDGMRVGIWTGTKSGSVSLGRTIMSMVDVIAYTGVILTDQRERKYVAQVVPAGGRAGGDRYDCLGTGEGYLPVNIQEWIRIIREHEQALRAGRPAEPPAVVHGTPVEPEEAETAAPAASEPESAAAPEAPSAREQIDAEKAKAEVNGDDESVSPSTRKRRAQARQKAAV